MYGIVVTSTNITNSKPATIKSTSLNFSEVKATYNLAETLADGNTDDNKMLLESYCNVKPLESDGILTEESKT